MPVAAIVQARTGSTRLPRKVLAPVEGKPLLAYLLERLQRARSVDAVVVATSVDHEDDPVAALAGDLGVDCARGPLADVAGRLLLAAHHVGADAFVRVSGDSPMLDAALVDTAVDLLGRGYEIATNVSPRRTFPHGQSVEAFGVDAFRRGYERMTDASDLEHVGPYFYRHASDFHVASFAYTEDAHELSFAVDTADDLAHIAALVGAMERPHWEYGLDELLELQRCLV